MNGTASYFRDKAVFVTGASSGIGEELIVTGHGKLLVLVERFAPWLIRAVARRLAARPSA